MRYTNSHSEKSAKTANREELSDAWFDEEDEDDDEITCINANRVTGEELQSSSESSGSTSSTSSSNSSNEEEELADEPLTFKEIEELAEEKGVSPTELWREASKTEDSSSGLEKTFEADHIERSLSRRKNSGWTEGGSIASESSSASSSASSSELSSSDDGIDLTVSVDSTEEPTKSELKKEAARQFDSRGGVWQEIGEELEQEVANSPDRVKTLHDGKTHVSITNLGDDEKRTVRTSYPPLKEELERVAKETDLVGIKGGSEDTVVVEASSRNAVREYLDLDD
ncbi:hypothetical protein [Haloarchaeobius sp. FL176]|uniref:hypothetical protein n=1 Tax=Haloarchaeobius sp. FL176 TaxID=2967129 RepID=UPI0021490906|nr:hypothetical protein [Haloarchaeobius sp. FL176]